MLGCDKQDALVIKMADSVGWAALKPLALEMGELVNRDGVTLGGYVEDALAMCGDSQKDRRDAVLYAVIDALYEEEEL